MSISDVMGKLFAVADYHEQAELLNAAGRMLRIADKLDGDGQWLVNEIARYAGAP